MFSARSAWASDPEMAGGGNKLSCPCWAAGWGLLPLLSLGEVEAEDGEARLLLMASLARDDCCDCLRPRSGLRRTFESAERGVERRVRDGPEKATKTKSEMRDGQGRY